MGVTSFSGSTSSVSFSFKPTATNSNITALKFNSNNQPNFEHTFVAHDNVDKGRVAENFDKFKNFVASTSATVVVGVGAVRFGAAKFGETILDANVNVRAWAISGVCQLFGNDEAAARVEKRATDFIARDLTGEAKEEFYENTSLGRAINEKSYMKYDSEAANKIQDVSQKATEIGVEVAAATLIPGGGVAVSAAIGAVSGMGKSAEKNYQAGNSMKESALDIVINTGTGALEGYSAGAMGSAAINGAKALSNLGIDGAKALAKEKFSSFSGKVALDTLKKNAGTVAKQSIFSTLKDPGFYLDTFGASSNDIIEAAKGETSWLDAGKAIIINTGVSFGTNYLFNYAGGVGSSVFDSANYGHKIDDAREIAFDNFDDFNTSNSDPKWNLSPEELSIKHDQIDQIAEKLYDSNAMDDYSKYYEVLGMEKGSRPDPSTYLRKDYMDDALSVANTEGVARYTSSNAKAYHEANGRIGYSGPSDSYMVGETRYTSSEFVSPKSEADLVLASSPSKAELANQLKVNAFDGEVYRYDINPSGANLRFPSGNEPGAYVSDWVPGGFTLGGARELVIDGVDYGSISVKKVFS